MPGLTYNGPFIHRLDVNSPQYDSLGLENVDNHWDYLNLPLFELPVCGALPLCPNKHKACWPAQSPSPWLKMKEQQQGKLLSSKHLFSERSTAKHNSSNESEHDLQAMVLDFMENEFEMWDNSDTDNSLSPVARFCDNLQALTSSADSVDKELFANLTELILAINEDTDLIHSNGASECKGSCTRRFVVAHLRSSGYNAALCTSRWSNSGRVPGGEYEYIDVIFEGDLAPKERLIVDIDFRAQFEIARPTQHYLSALKSLPAIFVGSTAKLEKVLEIMSEAAKGCWRQNCLLLPPWRTLEYTSAKWMSQPERRTSNPPQSVQIHPCSFHWRSGLHVPSSYKTKLCGVQLRRTKVSLLAEMKGSTLPVVAISKGRSILRTKVSYR